jgi:hypothetical protein
MPFYDAHIGDVGNTITKTLTVGGVSVGDLSGATFSVAAIDAAGTRETWTAGFVGGAGGRVVFTVPAMGYFDCEGPMIWDVTYTLGGVTRTADPVELLIGPDGGGGGGSPLACDEAGCISVTDSGAAGDGTTDDTTACQAALDAVAALPYGGVCYFPPGVYLLSNCLLVGSHTHVLGAGTGITTLRGHAGGYPGKTVNGHGITATLCACAKTYVTIEHLTVDHATNATEANGITFECDQLDIQGTPVTHGVIRDCEVLGAASHQYLIWSLRSKHCRIEHCKLDGGIAAFPIANPTPGWNQEGIEICGGEDVTVQCCHVRRIGAQSIGAIAIANYDSLDLERITIIDNVIEGSTGGIGIAPFYDALYGAQNAIQILVARNKVYNVYGTGLTLATTVAGATFRDVCFSNNQVDLLNHGTNGIYCSLVTASEAQQEALLFDHNQIRNAAFSTGGAVLVMNAAGVTLRGNEVYDSALHAFYLVGNKDLRVESNKVKRSVGYAVNMYQCDDFEVSRNWAEDVNSAGLPGGPYYYAFYLVDSDRGLVKNNSYRASTTARDAIVVYVVNSCKDVATCRNRKLPKVADYSNSFAPVNLNIAAGANCGSVTFTLGATFMTVTTKFARPYGTVLAYQASGTQRSCQTLIASPNGGSFTITIDAAADGTEVFQWEIVQ